MCFGGKSPQVKKAGLGTTQTMYDPIMDSSRNARLKNQPAPTSDASTMIADQAAPTPAVTSTMQ